MAGRKWPAVQAGVVLRSGPGLKVDLWRNPSFDFGDAGLDWFQTQLLIVNAGGEGTGVRLVDAGMPVTEIRWRDNRTVIIHTLGA